MTRLEYLKNKIVSPQQALSRIGIWKIKGEKFTFTNGCFDLLHAGHVTYLMNAAECSNRLIVGLNSDSSVKRQNKGPERPLNQEDARAMVLAALSSVDLVVVFDNDTPQELIQLLKPDVLAKGADYDPDERDTASKKYIVGSDYVRSYGGAVVAIPFVEGYSTTKLVEKMK